MAISKILKHIVDIKIVESTGGTSFTVGGGANKYVLDNTGTLTIPDGYTKILEWVVTNGDASVISVGFQNNWVHNTKSTTSSTLNSVQRALCVKFG